MRDLSLHILDIAENSIEAGAGRIEIELVEDRKGGRFVLRIRDDGKGMDAELVKKIEDPFFTMKSGKRWGLGIPFLAQAARQCGGEFAVRSEEGVGTEVVAEFALGHIDRQPLGDVGSTMAALVAGHPRIEYSLRCESDGESYGFETRSLREALDPVPVNVPEVLKLLKDDINEGIRRTLHEG